MTASSLSSLFPTSRRDARHQKHQKLASITTGPHPPSLVDLFCCCRPKRQQRRPQRRLFLRNWYLWILIFWGSILYVYLLVWNRLFSVSNLHKSRHHHHHHHTLLIPQNQQQQQLRLRPEVNNLLTRFNDESSLRISVGHQQQQQHALRSSPSNSTTTRRYLIYRPPLETAQGVGNLMNGLLAAHMLGMEFNRIVCVSKEWNDFHIAFQIVTPECDHNTIDYRQTNNDNNDMLWVINFGQLPINECKLRSKLESNEEELTFVANTYPGAWPNRNNATTTDVSNLFHRYYRSRPELLNLLPWRWQNSNNSDVVPAHEKAKLRQPPNVVVHLRQPDNINVDPRNGLDSHTLEILGQTLPTNSTYLVTNQIQYYTYFNKFGWLHPSWDAVSHSAKKDLTWSTKATTTTTKYQASSSSSDQQVLQLWSDWLTIQSALKVYHTNSDFSMSAIRWGSVCGDIESYTIQGTTRLNGDNNTSRQLILEPDDVNTAASNGTTITLPFSERDIYDLKNCDLRTSGLDGLRNVLDMDDEYHDDSLR